MKTWHKVSLGLIALSEAVFTGAGLGAFMMNLRRRPEWDDGIRILSQDDMRNDFYRRKHMVWINSQKQEKYERVSFDGLKLKATYVYNEAQTETKERKVVLFSHGYGGKGIGDMSTFADYYSVRGYDMFFPDQRTHGESEGTFITFGANEHRDIQMWCEEIVKKWGPDCKIVLHGWSMGAATAYLSVCHGMPSQLKCLVFDCGYCSAYEEFMSVAKHAFPLPEPILHWVVLHAGIWTRLLAHFPISEASPLHYADRMKLPVLFVHGAADDFVPTWMGHKLYAATKNVPYKDQLIVPDAGHVMSYVYDRDAYQDALDRLLDFAM